MASQISQIVFRTAGFAKAFVSTTGSVPFVRTSGKKVVYALTTGNSPIVLTSGKKTSFFQTTSVWPIVKTTGTAVAFVVTPSPNPIKDLVPKIGTLEFTGDYTIINVPDATGDYNSSTNKGGYNVLPSPYNPYRPYRENVSLWTVYKVWNVYGADTQTPSAQAQAADVPYLYPLSLPTESIGDEDVVIKGIYEIILIAAPKFDATDTGGTYASDTSGTYNLVTGSEGTTFTSLSVDDYLYYVDIFSGNLKEMNQVDHVFSNTEVNLQGPLANTPAEGDLLYGSAAAISGMKNSDGVVANDNVIPEAPFTLLGTNTLFETNFLVGDYIYIVSATTGEYKLLGQADAINSETELVVNTPNPIEVNNGDYIWANASALSLIDLSGTYAGFDTNTYYNVEGTGTTFLTKAEVDQYLFYFDSTTGNYVQMGQIFRVYDDTNVWLYSAPSGDATTSDELFTSYSQNTTTADYNQYIGATNLYDIAKESPDWYVTSVGIMVDNEVVNCLNRMRYEFLQEVMCGKCPEGYLNTYSIYVGMLNAMEIQDWTTAIDFYNKLKTICSEDMNSSCGC